MTKYQLLFFAAVAFLTPPVVKAQVKALQADEFVDSIGVNTHFAWPVYAAQTAELETALERLGVRHLRDSLVRGDPSYYAVHNRLARHGIRTLYIEPGQDMGNNTAYNALVDDVEAFEPPNEQNLRGSTYYAANASAAASYAHFLREARQLVPSGYPFLGPSFSDGVDFAALTDGGYWYGAAPPVKVSGGGHGMVCSTSVGPSPHGGNRVTGCSCHGGEGYSAPPTLEIGRDPLDSFGTGATAVVTVSHGAAASCRVQNLTLPAKTYDANNVHYYQAGFMPETTGWGDRDFLGNPYGSLPWQKDIQTTVTPHLPNWVTEAGYYTAVPKENSLDEASLAAFVPRLLLNNFASGFTRTYLYELYDEQPNSKDSQNNYGLVRNNGSYKPSFMAIQNLINLLADVGPHFSPDYLAYTLTGDEVNVHRVLLEKRDHSFWLAVWIAAPTFNTDTRQQLTVPPQQLTLTLPVGHRIEKLYQFNEQGALVPTASGGQSLAFHAKAEVSILEIRSVPGS